jgi:DNA-binding NarL/FixJ family response regulator
MDKINILVVDDCEITRKSIEIMFAKSKRIQVAGQAAGGVEAIKLIKKSSYDGILMDINMPDIDGVETTKKMLELDKNIKVLGNSTNVEARYVRGMIGAGASGYITKCDEVDDYREAIWTIVNGGIYLSDEITTDTYNEVFVDLKKSQKVSY